MFFNWITYLTLCSVYEQSILLLQYSVWNHPESSLITFGQIRTGDGIYAKMHDKLISPCRKLRFVNQYDIATSFPVPMEPKSTHHSR